MKAFSNISLLFVITAFVFSCANAPEGEKAEIGEAGTPSANASYEGSATYIVNTDRSVIKWKGSKPTGQHNGILRVKEGNLIVRDGKIVGGEITLDMNSITNLDMDEEGRAKLERHLKTGDFFETDKYPTGTFQILKVTPDTAKAANYYSIMGNLTLKDIRKSVTLSANVIINQNFVTAVTPDFTIDRTQWGINFKSTAIGALADEAIHDEIGLLISLSADVQKEQ